MPGPSISQTDGPANESYTHIYTYSGSNITCNCTARSSQRAVTLTATISAASTAIVTSTAHGLASDNRVLIAGGTGDWVGVNGTQIITRVDADTFSIATNSGGYSGSFAGTVTTTAPRTSQAMWAITKTYYDGSGNTVRIANALGTTAEMHVADNVATIAFE